MSKIKILEKITQEEYNKVYAQARSTEPLGLKIEDFGFCIKYKLTEEEQIRWNEIRKWREENIWKKKTTEPEDEPEGKANEGETTKSGVVSDPPEMPRDMEEDFQRLQKKVYKDFAFAEPGNLEKTMKQAKKFNKTLDTSIPKGARIYYTYPLSCIVVAEITKEITETKDFIEAFCVGYQEIYKKEEETSTKKAMPLSEEDPDSSLINRNKTDGCYGIWGHSIEDLVLEAVWFFGGGKYIFLSIGS